MTKEELKSQLDKAGFKMDRNSEYHNDAFINEQYDYEGKMLYIEIFVDKYNVRIIWWHQKDKKVSKCYYVNKEIMESTSMKKLVDSFISEMISIYEIKL